MNSPNELNLETESPAIDFFKNYKNLNTYSRFK